jgi:hypothetical protein
MAKAAKPLSRARASHKTSQPNEPARKRKKPLRLPLPTAVREYVDGLLPHLAEVEAAMGLSCENATRKEVDAIRTALFAARARRDAYVEAALRRHVGKVTHQCVELRPFRTLDDIVMAAVIGMGHISAERALVPAICKAAGFNYKRELWGFGRRTHKRRASSR